MELVRAIGPDEDDPFRLCVPRQIAEELKRRLVGPVQIFNDDHEGRRAGDAREEPGDPLIQTRTSRRVDLTALRQRSDALGILDPYQ